MTLLQIGNVLSPMSRAPSSNTSLPNIGPESGIDVIDAPVFDDMLKGVSNEEGFQSDSRKVVHVASEREYERTRYSDFSHRNPFQIPFRQPYPHRGNAWRGQQHRGWCVLTANQIDVLVIMILMSAATVGLLIFKD